MQFKLSSTLPKRLKAVYGVDGNCIFFEDYTLHSNGVITERMANLSLEQLLSLDKDRKPIYEGDTLTITF